MPALLGAGVLTPRTALEKLTAIRMVDLHLPTTDGRTLILSRYTEPEKDQHLMLQQLRISVPQHNHRRGFHRRSTPIPRDRLIEPTFFFPKPRINSLQRFFGRIVEDG